MKKAQQVVDIQKKIEILKVKKEYINDILKEADCGRKNNLDSLTELEYMDKISLLEAEVNKIKNYGLQSSLIKQIQINDKLQTSIFKLKRQVCLLSRNQPKNERDTS
ncbi:8369_t:CDS:2 [Gigaspora rosea]|nr:8369_t:CDS:2 [Gigaspora rosea]